MTSVDYVRNLVRLVPSLLPAMDEHLKDNDEMLPHVFFGDLTRVVVNMQKMSDENQRYDDHDLDAILQYLEEGIKSTSPEIRELISASFIENLVPGLPHITSLKTRMGRELKSQYMRQWG